MKIFTILAALTLSAAAFAQTICDTPPTGSQPYSQTGSAQPQSAELPVLGYFATGDVYVPLPGMPTTPTSFCGPLWEANYPYVVGNMIEPLPLGAVFQAVANPDCVSDCMSGSTQPPGFWGTLILPSNIYVEISTCSDTGTTATCTMIGPVGSPSPLNLAEPYQGAVVGSTVVIQNYSNSAYNGSWVVTASTNPPGPPFESPFTFSFTASGLGSGDCTDFQGGTDCIAYQQGTQIIDGGILWQYAGPQDEFGPTVVVTPSPFTITTAQALDVTVAVGGGGGKGKPTGTVTLTSGSYSSAVTTLDNNGNATINVPAKSLAVGMDVLTATYSGDDNYSTATGINSVTVTGAVLLTPTVTVTPSASSITTAQALSVTVALSGGSGNPTPTGMVTLTSGSYSSGTTTLTSGSVTITIPAGSLAVGTDTLTGSYSGDSNYNPAVGTSSVTVTEAQTPGFTITGTPVSVSPGASTGNTSTITVTPSGGFTDSVTLTAAITSNPPDAQDLPTLNFGSTSPVNITGSAAGTATLTISTTAATSGALVYPARPGVRWYGASVSGLMAFGLLFGIGGGIPMRRRRWRPRSGTLVLLVTFLGIGIGGLLACGSRGSGNSGTTPGTYIVTVTGTSGTITATGTVTLTVQ